MYNHRTSQFRSRVHTHPGTKANTLAMQHRAGFGHTTFPSPQTDLLPL